MKMRHEIHILTFSNDNLRYLLRQNNSVSSKTLRKRNTTSSELSMISQKVLLSSDISGIDRF